MTHPVTPILEKATGTVPPAAGQRPAPAAKPRRWVKFLTALLVVAVGGSAAWAAYTYWRARSKEATADKHDKVTTLREATKVKTIHPLHDPSFAFTLRELVAVEPFFQADLYSRVSGPVKLARKDKGDRIRRGELLVEIDVPDLLADVAQREVVIAQRKAELLAARAKVKIAESAITVANQNIAQKEAELEAAEATAEYRKMTLGRLQEMVKQEAVTPKVVDEEKRNYLAGVAACSSAKAGVAKARADSAEAAASLEAARADVEVKLSLVEVAVKDRQAAEIRADMARIRSPFDGIVVERRVDPGTFVQNGTTARTEPLYTVARTDLVTLTMKIPDTYADLVSRDTPVTVEVGDRMLGAKVTRFTPVIGEKDRTITVEVDLFNGGAAAFHRLFAETVGSHLMSLGRPEFVAAAGSLAAATMENAENTKGTGDFLPQFPASYSSRSGVDGAALIPGMSGYMRLSLRKQDAHLLPTGAVFSRGGKRYVFLVEKNHVRQVPVEIQVDDGQLLKTVLLEGVAGKLRYVELTGNEEIVLSGQSQLNDGQTVAATAVNWQGH